MNKRFAVFTVLTAVFTILAGCSAEEEKAKQENKFGIAENSYFDTSDLEESGYVYTQSTGNSNPASHYDFDGESCPEFESFASYSSPDGESFAFDSEGRLRYYCNSQCTDESADGTIEKLSNEQLREKCKEVLGICIENIGEYNVSNSLNNGISEEDNLYTLNMSYAAENHDDMDSLAIIKMNVYGDIRSIVCYYDAVLSDDERDFFNEKVSTFVEGQKNPVYDYTYSGDYYRIDGKLYGLIDVVLEDEPPEGEEDGTLWVECVGFVK